MEVNIILSDTFSTFNIVDVNKIVNETIAEFVSNDEKIINIEMKEHSGQFRFWIYTLQKQRGE